MRDFIENTMQTIFDDFQDELNNYESCCYLKNLRFDKGNIPDYSDKLIQQLYMLRYFPAYLIEYYTMYKKLKEIKFLEQYNVLSIGCGCGIDYYGLYFALDENIDQICYTGIDKVDWLYRNDLGNENCYFIMEDITNWNNLDKNGYNLIVFPKSIGEFDQAAFQKLKIAIKNTRFEQDKICLISSARDSHIDSDVNRLEELIQVFEDTHKFNCNNKEEKYIKFKENAGLRKFFPEFEFPNEILDYLISLLNQCKNYTQNDYIACSTECEVQLNKWPILRTGHIKFQIKRLER